RPFGWIDGEEYACVSGRALAANGGPSACDARRDLSFRSAGRPRRMAPPDTDRRQPSCHRVRYLSACRPTPPTGIGEDTADAIGALVLRRGHRAWRGTDARTDL